MTPDFPSDMDIARYLAGECTPAERGEIERRLESDQQFAADVTKLRAAFEAGAMREGYGADRRASLWNRIVTDTVNATPETRPELVRARRTSGPRPFAAARSWEAWQIAAALLIAVGGVASVMTWQRTRVETAVAPAPMKEIATRRAERANIYLSDGTHVKLAPGSRIRFAQTFGTRRDVHLEGQAYFDVAQDATRPFAVHTARGVARNIGTRFAVDAVTGNRLEVVVEEGIVALGSEELRANDIGRVTATGAIEIERGVDVKGKLAWTEGRLEFKDAPLSEVLPVLARWYDVDLQAGDSTLARYPITLKLTTDRLADALAVLEEALQVRAVKRGAAPDTHLVLLRRKR